MKKHPSKPLRESLALACCSLLHTTPEAQAGLLDDVDIDTAVLLYSESDGRVSVFEPVIKLKTELEEDEFLSLQLVFDVLTGASPNGAQAADIAQTFTSPSGNSEYTTAAGKTPLDNTFEDNRLAITASLEKPIDRLSKNIYSLSLSGERDWSSMSAGYTYNKDLQLRNTTFMAGLSLTYDAIKPTGGAPISLAPMLAPGDNSSKQGNVDRNSIDIMAGITQILSRKTITQFNIGLSQSSGYHNDPYKLIGLIDDIVLSPTYGRPTGQYLYESRPDNRQRQTLYWKTVHHLTEDVIHFSWRYYQDDWDISSHTFDLKYRYELSERNFLQPHIRHYSQSAASFYHHSLLNSETLPEFASADTRLGEFNAITLGLKFSHKIRQNESFSSRLEIMQQSGNHHPSDAIGEQLRHDLFPDLTAYFIQFSYSFLW